LEFALFALELLLGGTSSLPPSKQYMQMRLAGACSAVWLVLACSATEPNSKPCNMPADEAKQCCMLADYLIASAAEKALLSAQGGYAESGDKVYAKISKGCIAKRQQLFDGECAGVEKYGYQKGQCTIGPYMAHRSVAAMLPKTAPPSGFFIKVSLCLANNTLQAVSCFSMQRITAMCGVRA
jgi:hypothetical protein